MIRHRTFDEAEGSEDDDERRGDDDDVESVPIVLASVVRWIERRISDFQKGRKTIDLSVTCGPGEVQHEPTLLILSESYRHSRDMLMSDYDIEATIFLEHLLHVVGQSFVQRELIVVTVSGLVLRFQFPSLDETLVWYATLLRYKRQHPSTGVIFVATPKTSAHRNGVADSNPFATAADVSLSSIGSPLTYARPSFLGLNTCGSSCARHVNRLPLGMFDYDFGYAECRNAGKSRLNEDMAVYVEDRVSGDLQYRAWVLFDGHGDWHAARLASMIYPSILTRALSAFDTRDALRLGMHDALRRSFKDLDREILETSKMRLRQGMSRIDGGATALTLVVVGDECWVANAGDSYAVAGVEDERDIVMLSRPHTIWSERRRLQRVARENPALLKGAFSRKLFEPPAGRNKWRGMWIPDGDDVGASVLYLDYHTDELEETVLAEGDVRADVSEADNIRFKWPMITGKGDHARLLGITRCARGVGDHYLTSGVRDVLVKPFLSSSPNIAKFVSGNVPETKIGSRSVSRGDADRSIETKREPSPPSRIVSMSKNRVEDFVVLATDGLWDVLTPQAAVELVRETVRSNASAPDVLTLAAEALVYRVRRRCENGNGWAAVPEGSKDDVSVFVVRMPTGRHRRRRRQRYVARATESISSTSRRRPKRVASPMTLEGQQREHRDEEIGKNIDRPSSSFVDRGGLMTRLTME